MTFYTRQKKWRKIQSRSELQWEILLTDHELNNFTCNKTVNLNN